MRGDRAAEEPGEAKVEEEPAKKRRCTASWARLIAKVFHADPLTCRKCGGKLKIVAYLHDQVAIKQILEHLGLSPPEEPKPPPAVHEVVRVPVDEEAGKSRLPEDRQISNRPPLPGGRSLPPRRDQPWEDASRRVLSLRRTAEGMLRAGTLLAPWGSAC